MFTEIVLSVFFNDTATTEIYTLSLHDALPILARIVTRRRVHFYCARLNIQNAYAARSFRPCARAGAEDDSGQANGQRRSEEHTSELQSRQYLVCRLLLEKKKSPHNFFSRCYFL